MNAEQFFHPPLKIVPTNAVGEISPAAVNSHERDEADRLAILGGDRISEPNVPAGQPG